MLRSEGEGKRGKQLSTKSRKHDDELKTKWKLTNAGNGR
jgi:hypothetical protein